MPLHPVFAEVFDRQFGLKELTSAVERAEQKSDAEVLAKLDMLIADCDPVKYLSQVKRHLGQEDSSDIDARVIVSRIQDCHRAQLTDVCVHCGQLEGLHSFAGNCCLAADWYSATGTFQKEEDRNERTIRTGLDSWLQSQAGC
jgi:hypothetical protein